MTRVLMICARARPPPSAFPSQRGPPWRLAQRSGRGLPLSVPPYGAPLRPPPLPLSLRGPKGGPGYGSRFKPLTPLPLRGPPPLPLRGPPPLPLRGGRVAPKGGRGGDRHESFFPYKQRANGAFCEILGNCLLTLCMASCFNEVTPIRGSRWAPPDSLPETEGERQRSARQHSRRESQEG